MRRDRFEEVYKRLEEAERALLVSKRAEYAGEEDVLRNFKQTAAVLGVSAEEVCDVLLMKHVQAVILASRDKSTRLNYGDARHEGFAQRVSDARNYLMLLAALIDERYDTPPILVPMSDYTLVASTRGE